MEKIDYTTGPFGKYESGTSGHILNALCHQGVPLHIVESVDLGREIRYKDEFFARYKYFEGIEQPLFNFRDDSYNRQKFVAKQPTKDDKHLVVPNFHLSLSSHDTPGFVISGDDATPELYGMLMRSLTNYTLDPWYAVHQAAGAFFQGGSHDSHGRWFYIEFWKSAGAQAYIDKLNAEYRPNQNAVNHE